MARKNGKSKRRDPDKEFCKLHPKFKSDVRKYGREVAVFNAGFIKGDTTAKAAATVPDHPLKDLAAAQVAEVPGCTLYVRHAAALEQLCTILERHTFSFKELCDDMNIDVVLLQRSVAAIQEVRTQLQEIVSYLIRFPEADDELYQKKMLELVSVSEYEPVQKLSAMLAVAGKH